MVSGESLACLADRPLCCVEKNKSINTTLYSVSLTFKTSITDFSYGGIAASEVMSAAFVVFNVSMI